jgi:FAD/FMN-containing dehydrogenase
MTARQLSIPHSDRFSWGGCFRYQHTLRSIFWAADAPAQLIASQSPILPYGLGRSYGDSCLNDGGILLETTKLDRFLGFDADSGILRCESGVSLWSILRLVMPHGWFLPVTPGTKFVTVGGAIANDVHGKNHHRAGNFGHHLISFDLVRSDGEVITCSPDLNAELFRATIGGLGLTGLITSAEFRLKRISSPAIMVEMLPFRNVEEFLEISRSSDSDFEYTVAWIDCLATGASTGRGVFIRGNHAPASTHLENTIPGPPSLSIPFNCPNWLLNPITIRLFNSLYYLRNTVGTRNSVQTPESFFYPLDAVGQWNRIYGKRGFFQYQCVLPKDGVQGLRQILAYVGKAGVGSFLSVLKAFGDTESLGYLSFPMPGYTLALDIPNAGQTTRRLFDTLDSLVLASRGRIYPAKDARMSADSFRSFYPNWQRFLEFRDPKFSSSFWRRVCPGGVQ